MGIIFLAVKENPEISNKKGNIMDVLARCRKKKTKPVVIKNGKTGQKWKGKDCGRDRVFEMSREGKNPREGWLVVCCLESVARLEEVKVMIVRGCNHAQNSNCICMPSWFPEVKSN
jgi:hypothetical protein